MKTTRRMLQLLFLALVLVGVFVIQGNAEQWCPFGGVEAIYTYFTEGNMLCSLGISNFYILAGVLLLTVVLRRVFCGYMCPIGTISEWLQSGVCRVIRLKPARVPAGLDRALSLLKYVALAVILYFTWTRAELEFRRADPCYALISRHGEDITFWAYVVAGAIVVASLFIVMPFCRWLCPFAAVLNVFSRFGLTRISRDPDTCIDCGQCARSCPTAIPVDKQLHSTNARCISCMNCLSVCPKLQEGALRWGPRSSSRRGWPQAVIVVSILLVVSASVAAVFAFPAPSFTQVVAGRSAHPPVPEVINLEVYHLTCRGKAALLPYYLERDDMYAISGYLKIEAWPGPGAAAVRITFDPAKCTKQEILEALTEPYFDHTANFWRPSPFQIEGYDPLNLDTSIE